MAGHPLHAWYALICRGEAPDNAAPRARTWTVERLYAFAVMELIRRFPQDLLGRVLGDWEWIPDLSGKVPLFASPFGDLFLQGEDGVWFLDLVEGILSREWDSPQDLQTELNTPGGQRHYLMVDLAALAHESGLVPGADQVLTFNVPPILGAPIEVSNVSVADYAVVMAVSGQLHRQIKDLPPGTPITGVTIDGEEP